MIPIKIHLGPEFLQFLDCLQFPEFLQFHSTNPISQANSGYLIKAAIEYCSLLVPETKIAFFTGKQKSGRILSINGGPSENNGSGLLNRLKQIEIHKLHEILLKLIECFKSPEPRFWAREYACHYIKPGASGGGNAGLSPP